MIVVTGIFLLVVGGVGGYHLANFPKWTDMQRNRVIQDRFQLKANEYTYIVEDAYEGTYLLSCENKEYRIKFSDNKPLQIVYAEEVTAFDETA